jgi:hypothetical protein
MNVGIAITSSKFSDNLLDSFLLPIKSNKVTTARTATNDIVMGNSGLQN